MKKVCMNYNEFMTAFKGADKNYGKKANVANKDSKTESKTDQDLATGEVKGKATAPISKYTKEHLSTVKSKNVVNGK